MLQDGSHLPFIHGLEPLHEFFNGSPGLQVLEQGGYGQSAVGEKPGTADLAWDLLHTGALRPINHILTSSVEEWHIALQAVIADVPFPLLAWLCLGSPQG